MAASVRAKVKTELLIWARESAGYSVAEAAKRLGVTEERLLAWDVNGWQEALFSGCEDAVPVFGL